MTLHVTEEYSHHRGLELLEARGLRKEVYDAFAIRSVGITRGSAKLINQLVMKNFASAGWVMDPLVHPDRRTTINAAKVDVILTLQTGNVARAFYDLLKFQAIYLDGRAGVAILAAPTRDAARSLGSNVADFHRLKGELQLFHKVITVPCVLLGLDEEEVG